jgi:exonuclease III
MCSSAYGKPIPTSNYCALPVANMIVNDFQILCWNVRGLNSAARCLAVHETIAATTCHIVCLQETKLEAIDRELALFLGAYRLNHFAFKPAQGTRGGILLLWNDGVIDMQQIETGRYSITTTVTVRDTAASFLLTGIYGPS